MTAVAIALAMLALPDCKANPFPHRLALAVTAHLAYLASGIAAESWVAIAEVESNCGVRNDTPLSSAVGPWHVIARHLPLAPSLRPALRWWPVNAIAAGVQGKRFQARCGQRWAACYRVGWVGRFTTNHDANSYLREFRTAERRLRNWRPNADRVNFHKAPRYSSPGPEVQRP